MAIPILNHLDLRSVSELQNAILHKTTSSSASDVEGKIIYDTGTDSAKVYNGSAWVDLGGDISRVNITAGNGLTGTVDTTIGEHTQTLTVVGGDGITANADEIEVTVDGSTIELDNTNGAGAVRIKDNGVTLAKLAHQTNNTVFKVSASGVPVAGTIDTANITADAVDGTKIADNAIDSEHYTDGSIDRVHLAADIVDGTKIADDSIDSEHIVDGSVDNVHLANDGMTIGTTDVSLGDTITALVGLTDLDLTAAAHTIFDTVGANNLTMGASTTTVIIPGDLQVTGTVTTNNVETVSTTNGVVFEGNVADAHEGTLLAGTLSADRTYTLPDGTGTIALTNNISDATITITAGNGLVTGGSFALNQSSDATITINHEDTSSQASVDNSGLTVIQDVTLDTYGHTTGLASVNLTSGVDGRITAREYSGLIGDGTATTLILKNTGATGTAQSNHGLGADSTAFMIQLIEVSTGATVYADVERAASGVVNVIFAAAPASNAIRVLMTKIG